MKRTITILISTIALLLALVLASAVAISYGWQRERVSQWLTGVLGDALEEPVSIGAVDGVLHRGVTLRDVTIGHEDGTRMNVARADLAFRAFSWSPVTIVDLDEFALSGLRVVIEQRPDGSWPGFDSSQASEPSPVQFTVGELSIDDTTVDLVRNTGAHVLLEIDARGSNVRAPDELAVDRLVLSFAASDGRPDSALRFDGKAEGSFAGDAWSLTTLAMHGPLLDLDAAGRGDLDAIENLQGEVRVEQVERLLTFVLGEPSDTKGSLRASVELAGPWSWPRGTVRVDARELESGPYAIGDLAVRLVSESRGHVEIDALRLSEGLVETELLAPTELVWEDDVARFDTLRLQPIGNPGWLEISARIPLDASDLARDERLRVELKSSAWPLAAQQPIWSGFGIELSGELTSDLVVSGGARGLAADGRVEVAGADLSSPRLSLAGADVTIEPRGPIEDRVGSVDARVQEVVLDERILGSLRLRARAHAGRRLSIDEFELAGGVADLRVLPGAEARYRDDGVVFDPLVALVDGQRISLSGGIFADRLDQFAIEVEALDTSRASALARSIGVLPEGPLVSGRITGRLFATGALAAPQLSGDLEWSQPQLGEFGFDRIDAQWDTREDAVELVNHWFLAGEAPLQVDLTLPRDRVLAAPEQIPLDPRSRLRATLSRFQLGALAPFLPSSIREVSGALDANVSLRGDAGGPRVEGSAALSEAFVRLGLFAEERAGPIEARATFSDRHVNVERLYLGEPGASALGSGTATLGEKGVESIDLRLQFDHYRMNAPGLVRGTLSGPIALTGSPDAIDLTGELAIERLRIDIPESETPRLKEIRIVTSGGEAIGATIEEKPTAPILDPVAIDVNVEIGRDSWARGRGIDVELAGDLHATKARRRPLVLEGRIATVRGSYRIYTRRFRIERGVAILDGSEDIDPILDIRAVQRIRDVEIYALIEGRLSEPQLRFESKPEVSENDIASYLLLGRPSSDLSSDQQLALNAVAAEIAAGAALAQLELLLDGAVPIDVIDVQMESDGDKNEVRAGVGKYVGDRLFLYYERGFGDDPEDELHAEYELTPNWSVQSTVTGEGETGGDIVFEIEY